MNTKSKHSAKPRSKKPKPNLHGPNSPTPKKKLNYDYEDDNDEYVITKITNRSRKAE